MSDDLIYESYRQIIYQVMQQLAGEANNGQMGYLGGYDPRRGNYAKYYGCRRSNRAGSNNVNLQRPSYISAPVPFSFKPRLNQRTSLFPIPNEPIDIPNILRRIEREERGERGRGDREEGDREKLLDLPKPRIIVPGFDKLSKHPNFGLKPGRPVPGRPVPGSPGDARIVRPRYPTIFLPAEQQIDYWPIVEWEVYGETYSEDSQDDYDYYRALVIFNYVYTFGGGLVKNQEIQTKEKQEQEQTKKLGSCSYITGKLNKDKIKLLLRRRFYAYFSVENPYLVRTDTKFYSGEYYGITDSTQADFIKVVTSFTEKTFEDFRSVLPGTPSEIVDRSIDFLLIFVQRLQDIIDKPQTADHKLEASSPLKDSRITHFKKPKFLNVNQKATKKIIFFYRNIEDLIEGKPFQEIKRATGFFVPSELEIGSHFSELSPNLYSYLEKLKKPEKVLAERTFWGEKLEIAIPEDEIDSYKSLISELGLVTVKDMTEKATKIEYMLLEKTKEETDLKKYYNINIHSNIVPPNTQWTYALGDDYLNDSQGIGRIYPGDQYFEGRSGIGHVPSLVGETANYVFNTKGQFSRFYPAQRADLIFVKDPRIEEKHITIIIPKSKYREIFKRWLDGSLPKKFLDVLRVTFAYWPIYYLPPKQIITLRRDQFPSSKLVFETVDGGEEFIFKQDEVYVSVGTRRGVIFDD